jgi:hypothetical protein
VVTRFVRSASSIPIRQDASKGADHQHLGGEQRQDSDSHHRSPPGGDRLGSDAEQVITLDAGKRAKDDQAVAGEFVDELLGAEPIFGGVIEQPPIGGTSQGVGGDLLEVKPPTRGEHPGDLGDGFAPVRDVMDDPEIECSAIAFVICS